MDVLKIKLSERAKLILAAMVEATQEFGAWMPRARPQRLHLSWDEVRPYGPGDVRVIKSLWAKGLAKSTPRVHEFGSEATELGMLYYERVLREKEDWASRKPPPQNIDED